MPSGLASCYDCSAPMQTVEEAALDMMHVASVHLKYFRCFRCMFQVFHMDVVKVDRNVAYAAMVVHGWIGMLQESVPSVLFF